MRYENIALALAMGLFSDYSMLPCSVAEEKKPKDPNSPEFQAKLKKKEP
jgi:hypothetical protein